MKQEKPKRKTPDSFYVHSYLLYIQLIFKNKKWSFASMKDQLIFLNCLLIKYLFIYLYIIFYTLIRLEAFFKYFKENMQCVSLKYLLLAINHIVKFVEMTICQHYQWPYCSHHGQLNHSPLAIWLLCHSQVNFVSVLLLLKYT